MFLVDLSAYKLVTPVSWRRLHSCLWAYPDRQLLDAVIKGFRDRFSLGLSARPFPWLDPLNRKLVQADPDTMWDLIHDEILNGAVIGPFENKPLPNLLVSLINFLKKLTSVGKKWLIQDFSYPYDQPDNGVNVLVPLENKKVKYSGVRTVVAIPWALQDREPLWAARMDIKWAFKNLPITKDQ